MSGSGHTSWGLLMAASVPHCMPTPSDSSVGVAHTGSAPLGCSHTPLPVPGVRRGLVWWRRRSIRPTGPDCSMVASPTGIRQSRLDRERKKPGRQLETSCGRAPGSVCNRYGALKDDKGAPRGAQPSQAPATMRRNCASCKKCAGSMRGRCCRQLPLRWIRCSSLAWCAAGRCRSCSNFIVHLCLGVIAIVVVRREVGFSEHPFSPVSFFTLLASSL